MTVYRKTNNRPKNFVFLSLIIAMVITGLLYFLTPVTVSTSISLQFEGIDKGKNPDNTRFDYTKLVAEDVLMQLFEDAELVYDASYLAQFEVKPVLPAHIVQTIKDKRVAGEDYTYFPNEFVIKVTPSRTLGLTESMCETLMAHYASTYEAYFNDHYTFPFMDLETLVNSFNFDSYDYPEYQTVFENEFAIISSYLNILERDDPEFISSEGYTFSDLQQGLQLTKSLDINKMSSIINSYKLSKDAEQLRIKYLYMIRRYTLQKSKAQSEYQMSQTLLDIVKQNKSTVIVPGMTGEALTYSAVNDTYDTIASQVTDAQVTSVNIDEEISYLNQKLYELDNPTHTAAEITHAKNDVNRLALALMDKVKDWVNRITSTATEYFAYKYENVLTPVYQMRISRVLSPLKAGVLCFALWLFLSFMLSRISYQRSRFEKTKAK
ncbi:hypothetical protein KHM83_15620 [Fusibacter paucivorans]|uniref:Lipopolysaccharide biosynthesis protein n=1 Tax=Fusibacter paucivorans TaxID=76009 RepID=A0ABS5PSG9_9FIRM|nr:hypothetical protein [Fusibacter paucivorans]MBS7528115.1 hypothetical protein [Fusibacter paucivorans]